MRIQRQLGNGTWLDETDDERAQGFLQRILAREPMAAQRGNREPMTTQEEVLGYLATGEAIRYDDDWYANLRDADALQSRQPKSVEMVRCDCGHTVSVSQRMSTSTGTSCPDCYDRMSR